MVDGMLEVVLCDITQAMELLFECRRYQMYANSIEIITYENHSLCETADCKAMPVLRCTVTSAYAESPSQMASTRTTPLASSTELVWKQLMALKLL